MWNVGVDEAGRGPVLGPLVVGAVALPVDDVQMLTERGVKDSNPFTHTKSLSFVKWFPEHTSQRNFHHTLIASYLLYLKRFISRCFPSLVPKKL